jgi:imidazolonepropionase-like amidohydrolase
MKFKKILNLLLFLNCSILNAEEYLIKNLGYIDVKSSKIISKKFIYIKNNIISKISSDFNPKDKIVIDLSNSYLLPGLIDSHSHILFTQTLSDKSFGIAALRESKLNPEFRIQRAKKFLNQYLLEGFTTLFDLGNSGYFLDNQLRNEINKNENYPLLYISGPGLATEHGQFASNAPLTNVQNEYTIINKKSDIDFILNNYINHKVDILKIYLDNAPGEGAIDKQTLSNILNNKHIKYFKKITFHSIREDGSEMIDLFKIKNVEHITFYNLSKKLTSIQFATPTDLSQDTLIKFNEYSPVRYIAQKNRTHLLRKSSINILFGPDFYFDSNEENFNRAKFAKKSTKTLTEAGFSPGEILKAMTINPALSISQDNKIGQIKVGAFANIIATNENPLKSINALDNLNFIMNMGKIIHSR